MSDPFECKHSMKPGHAWSGVVKSPTYLCSFCEMERLTADRDYLRSQLDGIAAAQASLNARQVMLEKVFEAAKIWRESIVVRDDAKQLGSKSRAEAFLAEAIDTALAAAKESGR